MLSATAVNIQVEIDSELASENQPITGKIVVVHAEEDQIDESTFHCQNSELAVQLLSEGRQSSITIVNGRRAESHQTISCFYFEIPGQERGKHRLSPVSVKVGTATYKSSPTLYQIYDTEAHSDFNLYREVEAPMILYPGQRLTIYYRLSLRTPIERTRDHLPLLNPEGFKKIGETKERLYRKGNTVICEFSQELEAQIAGNFEVEESFIEGLAYREDFFSRRVYKKPKLRAKAAPITLKVAPFPAENRPSSFEGTIGDFQMKVELLSDSDVCIGDKVELRIAFSGKGMENLKLPQFSKQKNLRANFRFNDLPATGQMIGGQKVFYFDLRPMKEFIQEVPSLEFSFFNPHTREYTTLKSGAIPLNIAPLQVSAIPQKIEKEIPVPFAIELSKEKTTPQVIAKGPSLIDISGVFPIKEKDLQTAQNTSFKTGLVVLLLGLLGLQLLLKKVLFRKRSKTSQTLLKEAFKYSRELQKYHLLLEKAFQIRLKEKGYIKGDCSVDQLQVHGIVGEVKHFLIDIQHALFSGEQDFDFKKNQKAAENLFKRIGEKS